MCTIIICARWLYFLAALNRDRPGLLELLKRRISVSQSVSISFSPFGSTNSAKKAWEGRWHHLLWNKGQDISSHHEKSIKINQAVSVHSSFFLSFCPPARERSLHSVAPTRCARSPGKSKRPMLGALRFPYKVTFAKKRNDASRYDITLVADDANRKKYGYKYMPIVKFVNQGFIGSFHEHLHSRKHKCRAENAIVGRGDSLTGAIPLCFEGYSSLFWRYNPL